MTVRLTPNCRGQLRFGRQRRSRLQGAADDLLGDLLHDAFVQACLIHWTVGRGSGSVQGCPRFLRYSPRPDLTEVPSVQGERAPARLTAGPVFPLSTTSSIAHLLILSPKMRQLPATSPLDARGVGHYAEPDSSYDSMSLALKNAPRADTGWLE